MTTNSVHHHQSDSRARMPSFIAVLLLIASMVFIGSALTGTAQAQSAQDAIPSITLDSDEPGQLTINWQAPEQAPTDYRIRWANADLGFPSYSAANEAERGNEYPLGDVTTLTLTDLTPGDSYKVQIRSRYYNADRTIRESSGPWTATATQRVKDHPPAAPTGLTTSSIEHDSLTIGWNDPQDANITGYQVLRGDSATNLSTLDTDTESVSTEYEDATVAPETTYHYAVVALSANGDSPQSSAISATTPADPPSGEQDEPRDAPRKEDPPQRAGARQAVTDVWTATLTPAALGGSALGCSGTCATALSDNDFTYDSTDYTVTILYVLSGGNLQITLNPDITTATNGLSLVVGTSSFRFADADSATNDDRVWDSTSVSWTAGTADADSRILAHGASDGEPNGRADGDAGQFPPSRRNQHQPLTPTEDSHPYGFRTPSPYSPLFPTPSLPASATARRN